MKYKFRARFSEPVPGTWTTIPSPITPQVDKKKPFWVPYRVFFRGSEQDKIRKPFPPFFWTDKNLPVVSKIHSQLVWCSFFLKESSSKESKEFSGKRFITFFSFVEFGVSRIRTDSDSVQIPIPNGFRFRTDFKSVWFRNLYGIGIRSDSRKKNQKMSKIENVIKLDE